MTSAEQTCRLCKTRVSSSEHLERDFGTCLKCMSCYLRGAEMMIDDLRSRICPLGWNVSVLLEESEWIADLQVVANDANIDEAKKAVAFAICCTNEALKEERHPHWRCITLIEKRALLATAGDRRRRKREEVDVLSPTSKGPRLCKNKKP